MNWIRPILRASNYRTIRSCRLENLAVEASSYEEKLESWSSFEGSRHNPISLWGFHRHQFSTYISTRARITPCTKLHTNEQRSYWWVSFRRQFIWVQDQHYRLVQNESYPQYLFYTPQSPINRINYENFGHRLGFKVGFGLYPEFAGDTRWHVDCLPLRFSANVTTRRHFKPW